MVRLFFFFALTASGLGFATSHASARMLIARVCVGSTKTCHPSLAQRLANERRWTLRQSAEARKRLVAGKVDLGAELAELLIPNIRPMHVPWSDRAVEGEVDYGAGEETMDGLFQDVVEGSSIAGSDPDEFAGILRTAMMDYSFGVACNEEFRRNFAAYLRHAVEPANLKDAWLFLSPRRYEAGTFEPHYGRLMRFEGGARAPPVRWIFADRWLKDQGAIALAHTRWGRSITAAVDAFWATNRTRLNDNSTVCPGAVAEWARVRQELLQKMLAARAARQRRSGH